MRRLWDSQAVWWGLALVLTASAFVSALVLLTPAPIRVMPDMEVYVDGVQTWLDGGNPYARAYPPWDLPFIYPPIALVVLAPLAFKMPEQGYVAVFHTVLLAITIWAVLRSYGRLDAKRVALGSAILLVAQFLEPVVTTTFFGQLGLVLMTMVIVDVLVVPSRFRGVLTGVAAMVKLTPLIFIVYFIWSRQFTALRNFAVTCVVMVGISLVWMPQLTVYFFTRVMVSDSLPGQVKGGFPSLHGFALARFGKTAEVFGLVPISTLVWLFLSAIVVVLTLLALRGLAPVRDGALAVSYLGVASVLLSPLSWTHHWVWAVPLAACSVMNLKRFPLLGAATSVLLVTMLDIAAVLKRLGVPVDAFAFRTWEGRLYVMSGLLVLLAGAWYGLRSPAARVSESPERRESQAPTSIAAHPGGAEPAG